MLSVGDVLGESDYKAKVKRQEAGQLAELQKQIKREPPGSEKTNNRPVDAGSKPADGNPENTEKT